MGLRLRGDDDVLADDSSVIDGLKVIVEEVVIGTAAELIVHDEDINAKGLFYDIGGG